MAFNEISYVPIDFMDLIDSSIQRSIDANGWLATIIDSSTLLGWMAVEVAGCHDEEEDARTSHTLELEELGGLACP